MEIKIDSISKWFGDHHILDQISMNLNDASILCITGPSGCGKTSLLLILAGLLHNESGSKTGFEHLKIGMMFQEPRLLPWLTAKENIGLVIRNKNDVEKAVILDELIELLGFQSYVNEYPVKLSGGMQQIISLARALAFEPDLLLMDEPFSSLDIPYKSFVLDRLKKYIFNSHIATLFVTHDVDECVAFAEKAYILSQSPAKIIVSLSKSDYNSSIEWKDALVDKLPKK